LANNNLKYLSIRKFTEEQKMRSVKSCANNPKLTVFIGLAALCVLLAMGCSKREDSEKAAAKAEEKNPPVVARVGKSGITVADFERYLADRPMPYGVEPSAGDLENRLDDMILQEVLYQEALRLKLDQNPEIRARFRQMLSQKLIDEQVNKKVWDREIGEQEIQEYFEGHWNEFNRPGQVRLADIFIAVPVDATNQEKEILRKKAQTVLSGALASRNKRNGFGKLIRKYSDKHEKYEKGDTGFFDIKGHPVGVDAGMAEAAFELERVGDLSKQLIETPKGYHIIMLTGRRSAIQIPLNSVREQLKQRIRRESIATARQAYIESLKEKAAIQIDSQSMDKMAAELREKAQARQAFLRSDKNQPPGVMTTGAPPAAPGSND
jgi:peptidyl-prolyl cis-trans isomerase C